MNLNNFYFVDLETGGLDAEKCDIVSICIIKYMNGIKEQWTSKVKPRLPVSKEAAKVNGYTEKDWEDAPYFEDLLAHLNFFITKDRYLVAHNVKFEYAFLGRTAERSKVKLNMDYHVFCTAQLAMEHLPLPKVSMNLVANYLDIPLDYHNVVSDTKCCCEIFKKLYRCSWIKRVYYRLAYFCRQIFLQES